MRKSGLLRKLWFLLVLATPSALQAQSGEQVIPKGLRALEGRWEGEGRFPGKQSVIVDIDETITIDPQAVEDAVGPRTRAVIPVHMWGAACDMDAIMDLADEYRLMVFEDACQAHGTEYFSAKNNRWQKAGSIGKAAAFSFYPGKNLGACGEAGAVTTNDEGIAQQIRMIRDHGQNKKYHHLVEGYNGRLDALQARLNDSADGAPGLPARPCVRRRPSRPARG